MQQYYVEKAHEAIIEPEEWNMVQEEIKRRAKLGKQFRGSKVFASRLVCADCGAFYGPKVWHSTDKYRSEVWQCNKRFQNRKLGVQCDTPFLTEEHIKKSFIKAFNLLSKDIYPDNIFDNKTLKYKFFNHFQKRSLERASEIVTISETMRNTLLKKGDFNNKLSVVYNFDISEVEKNKTLKPPYFFDQNQFNVVYAGNIGYVQDLDVILTAAKLLMHEPRITFHIFGEGSQAVRINNRIREENIINATYYPPHSVEESSMIYKFADVNLISILPGIIETALPLKTASCIAAKKPIIFIGLESFYHQEEWVDAIPNLHTVNYRNYQKLADKVLKLFSEKNIKRANYQTPHIFNKIKNVEVYCHLINKYDKY